MIQIEDNDMPIDVAQKLITAVIAVKLTPALKVARKAIVGDDAEEVKHDRFELEELKEIADYLMVFYNSHSEHVAGVSREELKDTFSGEHHTAGGCGWVD